MEYSETRERAAEVAAQALAVMAERGIPANPNNFAIWFHYFTGRYPDLARTLDMMIENALPFDEIRNAEIFRRFFSFDQEGEALNAITRELHGQLEEVLAQLDDAGQGVGRYGDALQAASGKLGAEDGGPAGFKDTLTGLINATRVMEEQNKALEARLGASAQEINQLKDDLERTRREALTDALTDIPNRKLFDSELRRAATDCMEAGDPLSLLMVDIDRFKTFNDTWGHQVGDMVLRLLAKTLKDCVKGSDLPARYGGEEFGVILPSTPLDGGRVLAESIRTRVSSKRVVNKATGKDLGQITVSIGVAEYRFGEPLGGLVARADRALYEAKNLGRDRVVTEAELLDDTPMSA